MNLPDNLIDLQNLYRTIRNDTIKVGGGSKADFDAAVKLEIEFKELKPTPANWVACALDVLATEKLRDLIEEEEAEAKMVEDEHNAWALAQEVKFDLAKEGF
jgi:hypothetical protein